MHVLLVATHWTPTFENCRRSLHIHEYDYTVLGYGEKWQGWKWRLRQYENNLPSEGCVLLLDAYDTILGQSPQKLLSVFKAHKKPILVGAEWYCGGENCGVVPSWWSKQKCLFKPWRQHANAGCIMGEVDSIRTMLKSMIENPQQDDQLCLAEYMNKNPDSFQLDYGSSLVQNVHIFDDLDSHSCIYHFPGPLLKQNYFPQYNVLVERVLSTSARKVHPSEVLEMCFFFGQLILMSCFFIEA
jgi:hypothetical protein